MTIKEFILRTVNDFCDLRIMEYDNGEVVTNILLPRGCWHIMSIPKKCEYLLDKEIESICPRPDCIVLEVSVVQRVEEVIGEKVGEINYLIEKNDFFNRFKYEWLADVIKLSLEYLTLDGLEDAMRASNIPDEILEICEKELNIE